MLASLQAYRGIAALLVLLAHAAGASSEYSGPAAFLDFWQFGRAGVQFFFVLSGFIIYYIHHQDIGRPGQWTPYITKRVIRVYPVYILVTLALAPFWLFVPSLGEPYHKDVVSLMLSLALLPQDHYPHLGAAWTLIHEMIFYVAFGALILGKRSGRVLFALWFGSIIVMNLIDHDIPAPPLYVLSINNLLFGLGMLAGYLTIHKRHWLKHGMLVLALGAVGFLLTGLVSNAIPHSTEAERAVLAPFFGVASFAIVLQASHRWLNEFFSRRKAILLLGDASYALYLIHYPVIALGGKVLQYLGIQLPPLVTFVLVTVAAVIAGVAFHLVVEKPLLQWLRRDPAVVSPDQLTKS